MSLRSHCASSPSTARASGPTWRSTSSCGLLLAGEPLVVYGDGGQTRDFTFVADIVEALVRAGAAPPRQRRSSTSGAGPACRSVTCSTCSGTWPGRAGYSCRGEAGRRRAGHLGGPDGAAELIDYAPAVGLLEGLSAEYGLDAGALVRKPPEVEATDRHACLSSTATPKRTGVVIRPRTGWSALELGELWRYRELLFFLSWRDVLVRYKQAVLGVAWAVLNPLVTMIVFTLIFGMLLGVDSGSDVPYAVFSYTALLPWNLFAGGVNRASVSLVAKASLLTKVYFPRLVIPVSSVFAGSSTSPSRSWCCSASWRSSTYRLSGRCCGCRCSRCSVWSRRCACRCGLPRSTSSIATCSTSSPSSSRSGCTSSGHLPVGKGA